MLLKYNRDSELEVVGLGVFQPGQLVMVVDEKSKNSYLNTGYFDEIKEKEIKIKVKKSKKKGDDKLCHKDQEDTLELKKRLLGVKK